MDHLDLIRLVSVRGVLVFLGLWKDNHWAVMGEEDTRIWQLLIEGRRKLVRLDESVYAGHAFGVYSILVLSSVPGVPAKEEGVLKVTEADIEAVFVIDASLVADVDQAEARHL